MHRPGVRRPSRIVDNNCLEKQLSHRDRQSLIAKLPSLYGPSQSAASQTARAVPDRQVKRMKLLEEHCMA